MRTEFEAIMYLLWASSFAFILSLMFIGFFTYWLKYHPRLARKVVKSFALFPVQTNNGKVLWLRWYYKYQEYEAGMVLGGSINQETYGKKITWSGSGSFIPSYKTKFVGTSYMGVRQFFKQDGWVSVAGKKRQSLQNLKNWERLLGKDLFDKWQKGERF